MQDVLEQDRKKNLHIQVIAYNYDPNLHGVLINDRYLYRSMCFFRKDELTQNDNLFVHDSPYCYYAKDSSQSADRQISEFKYWFNYKADIKLNSHTLA